MQKRFSVGEMAKIHNVSTQTLRYYDKIGLFRPEIIDNNKYRYYTLNQFEQLDTIKHLKLLGMSLKDIKGYLEKRNIVNTIKLLNKQKNLVDKKIRELNIIRNKIDNKIISIRACAAKYQDSKITIKKLLQRNMAIIKLSDNSDLDFELSLKKLQKIIGDDYLFLPGNMGVMLAKENLLRRKFDKFKAVYFILEDESRKNTAIKALPQGKYACIYHQGSYDSTYKTYEKLLDYIEAENYKVIGDALEISLIDTSVVRNEKDYLTEIQIPIK